MAKGAKAKGSSAERELQHLLVAHGFAVIRAAGSGSATVDACDLIAGKAGKSFAIEVKSCAGARQYIAREQMAELLSFSTAFGATPIIAVKWTRKGWGVLEATAMRTEGKLFGVKQDQMRPVADWLKAIAIGFDVHSA